MSELTPQIVDAVVAACQAGAAEAGQALSRALDMEIRLAVGTAGSLQAAALPAELSGPGLALLFTVGSAGALLLVPESSGLVPAWCAAPDPTGQSKLATLAQELGMILLPETLMAEDFRAVRVKSLAEVLRRGGMADGAAVVPLELSAATKATARLIWPIPQPLRALDEAAAPKGDPDAPQTPAEPPAATKAAPRPTTRAEMRQPTPRPRELPPYTRSLLRIRVPVVVTLAEKRQALGRIVELGPGSIIQFDKSCEEMLDLSVGNHPLASGEAVKVGDKFGLRITSITLPEERFHPVKPAKKGK